MKKKWKWIISLGAILAIGATAAILGATVLAVNEPGTSSTQKYYIINQNSGKALENASSNNYGQQVIQYTFNGGEQQKWKIESVGTNIYKITSAFSGQALDVWGGSMDPGAMIIQWPYGGGSNQHWYLTSLGSNAYVLKSVLTGQAIDVPGGLKTSNTGLVQWPVNGGENQTWLILPAAN